MTSTMVAQFTTSGQGDGLRRAQPLPLGHRLLSMFGHPGGESMVDKLTPMLKDTGFSDFQAIPTCHKSCAFIRAR